MEINLRIVQASRSDAGSIAATSGARPASNLQNDRRGAVWRSSGTAPQTLTGDFGALRAISAVVLWRHNLSSSATWRVRLWDAANQTGNLVYDSGVVQPVKPKALGELDWGVEPFGASLFTGWALAFSNLWFTTRIARSWQIDLTDANNLDGYLQASRLMIGPALTAFYGFEFGTTLTWEDPSEQQRTDGGSIRVIEREPNRVMTLSLPSIVPEQRLVFQEFGRQVGTRRDIFVSAYPEEGGAKERDYAFVGRVAESVGLTNDFYDNHNTALRFLEC